MNDGESLSATLAQPARAGAYYLPAEEDDGVARLAEQLGLVSARIDLEGCADKAEFLRRVALGLRFPAWFGHNWDALSDCLSDLSWMPGKGYVLIFEHADRFRMAAEGEFVTALDIFEDAARGWAEENVPMWIFVNLARAETSLLRRL